MTMPVTPTQPTTMRDRVGKQQPTQFADGRNVQQTHKRAQQNVQSKRSMGQISSREIDAWLAQRKQQADQAQQDPYADSMIQPTTYKTSDITPTSLQSYSPDDPRANPILTPIQANGGFLPPPPV